MEGLFIKQVKTQGVQDGSYLDSLPLVKHLNKNGGLEFHNNVTFFVGENGTGKSTLLEAIAVCAGYNSEGGSKNFHFTTGPGVSNLHKYLTLSRQRLEKDGFFLRAESLYNVATQIDAIGVSLEGYGGKSLHEQSHGESFLSLVQNRFRGNGLYMLDEPESALSPSRQLTLLMEIKRLADQGSQFLIATHSPILLTLPGAGIYQITEMGIEESTYENTEHYRFMKMFLNHPDAVLRHLFTPNGEGRNKKRGNQDEV